MVYSLWLLSRCRTRYRKLCVLPVFTCASYIILETEWILAARVDEIGVLADYAWSICELGWMACVWIGLHLLATTKGACVRDDR